MLNEWRAEGRNDCREEGMRKMLRKRLKEGMAPGGRAQRR
jgi:hypothetical protein